MAEVAHLVRYPDYELLQAHFVRHRFSLHTHDAFVLAVIDGGVEALHVGGERLLAGPGDVVLLSPGEAHDGSAHDTAGFAYRAVYPSQRFVALTFELTPGEVGARSWFTRNLAVDPQVAGALRTAHTRLANCHDPLAGESALVHALAMLRGRYGTVAEPRLCPAGPAAAARDLLEARLGDRVSLLELARACGATPLQVLRAFRASYGIPPHRYQVQRRVEVARRHLGHGADIATLAAELGFADQSHFTRAFKSVVGVTPGAYRRAAAT
jgi:AraC-like DNA-binding protein